MERGNPASTPGIAIRRQIRRSKRQLRLPALCATLPTPLIERRRAWMRNPCVYMMASRRNGTLYTGVTASLERRVHRHREGSGSAFAKRYGCRMLVWYERYERMVEAIAREKQIKAGSRRAKLALIETMNPDWLDLYETLNQ